jgi:hypothetical protein
MDVEAGRPLMKYERVVQAAFFKSANAESSAAHRPSVTRSSQE